MTPVIGPTSMRCSRCKSDIAEGSGAAVRMDDGFSHKWLGDLCEPCVRVLEAWFRK